MERVSLLAPAKINLCLHVGAKQPNGLHGLESLALFANIGDRIEIEQAAHFTLTIEGPFADGLRSLSVEKNLLTKAVRALAQKTQASFNFSFRIIKNLPPASGMGGGTADAAAALYGLSRLRPELANEDMAAVMRALGSDGPICLAAHADGSCGWWMSGTGSEVTPGPGLPECYFCLLNPAIPIKTADIFAQFDAANSPRREALEKVSGEWDLSSLVSFMGRTGNDLTERAIAIAPIIGTLIKEMSAQDGVLEARMTGSGATIFGLFAGQQQAEQAARYFVKSGYWAKAVQCGVGQTSFVRRSDQ